jgi:sigma-B regulation protein RsbU (phosphoserine phosphatase)
MKWVLLGIYGASFPMLVSTGLTMLDARLSWLWWLSYFASPLLPLSILVSVLRFNLFDVDRVLSTTASYNVLGVALVSGVLIAVPRIADFTSPLLGIEAGTAQVVLSLALAGLVIPLHQRLRPQIDRLFFKERFALDRGIAELLPTLSSCRDTRELTERVGAGLDDLLRPDACVVYAASQDVFAPVFVRGRAVPPAFEAESPLVGTLRARHSPLALSDAGRRPDEAALGPFDRAALETLQAEVIVPVRQNDVLAAFVCLGPRRSGDVYTAHDVTLLTAVAETASRELRHFDQEAAVREAREMQESLRRYVPGAIADQIASGTELISGEREVSVLFVDLRGYTSFLHPERSKQKACRPGMAASSSR